MPRRDVQSRETPEGVCDFAGHEWGDAGGGLEICTVCQAERWSDDEIEVADAR